MTAPALNIANGTFVFEFDGLWGWSMASAGQTICWFSGHLADGSSGTAAAAELAHTLNEWASEKPNTAPIDFMDQVDGNFAFAAAGPGWSVAAVDRVRSIPLNFSALQCATRVSPSAARLNTDEDPDGYDPAGLLCFAMAGYTVGRATIRRDIRQLMPGEMLYAGTDGKVVIHSYASYRPSGRDTRNRRQLLDALSVATIEIFETLAATTQDRPIVVPLSAGMDSRLVVAALHHLGIGNVRCYAYGKPGNFEAEASRRIADHLGYQWDFVPYSLDQQRRTFSEPGHADFQSFANDFAALPFQQDFHAVDVLRKKGFIPPDAVIVNGQSGDYLTGNHIPAELCEPVGDANEEKRWSRVFNATVEKHFSHWQFLKTPENLSRISALLREDLHQADMAFGDDPAQDFGLFEGLEFRNRQAKYVIGGQRIYDLFELEWRLPLWDRQYMTFWQDVPLEAKRGRNLFLEMLAERNWGGVWRGWDFPQRITPRSLAHVRWLLKALHIPLGRKRWHRFERRYLDYFMDVLCNYAIVPYARVIRDDRGFRNALSWHIDAYLSEKGIRLEELSRGAHR